MNSRIRFHQIMYKDIVMSGRLDVELSLAVSTLHSLADSRAHPLHPDAPVPPAEPHILPALPLRTGGGRGPDGGGEQQRRRVGQLGRPHRLLLPRWTRLTGKGGRGSRQSS